MWTLPRWIQHHWGRNTRMWTQQSWIQYQYLHEHCNVNTTKLDITPLGQWKLQWGHFQAGHNTTRAMNIAKRILPNWIWDHLANKHCNENNTHWSSPTVWITISEGMYEPTGEIINCSVNAREDYSESLFHLVHSVWMHRWLGGRH